MHFPSVSAPVQDIQLDEHATQVLVTAAYKPRPVAQDAHLEASVASLHVAQFDAAVHTVHAVGSTAGTPTYPVLHVVHIVVTVFPVLCPPTEQFATPATQFGVVNAFPSGHAVQAAVATAVG